MKKIMAAVLCLALLSGLAAAGTGCDNSTRLLEEGTLTFNVTDAPPAGLDITGIMITLSKLEVHKAVAKQAQTTATETTATETTSTEATTSTEEETEQTTGEWLTIDIPAAAQTFDLLKVKDITQLLATAQVTEGLYTQVRLTVEKAELPVSSGEPITVTVPSRVLKIVHPFEVVAGETTTLTLDFDAEKSVTVTGNNKVQIKPVIKLLVEKTTGPRPAEFNEVQSRELAEDFIKNSPTFLFDGMPETLALKETVAQSAPNTWQFTYEFQCRQAGYGDRTGQMLAQVITPHQTVIIVEKGSVISAVLDGQWNEMTQEAIILN